MHAQASPPLCQTVDHEPPLEKVQYFSFLFYTDKNVIFFPLEMSAFVKLTKMHVAQDA